MPPGISVRDTSLINAGMSLKWCGAVLQVTSWKDASGKGRSVASAYAVSMLVSRRWVALSFACSSIALLMSEAITLRQYGAMAKAVKPGPVAMSRAVLYLFPATHLRTIARLSLCWCGTLVA